MASSSSSSFSTLSAKARPFVPPRPRPPALHPSSSQSTLSAEAPPFTKSNSNRASRINSLIGAPYYPSYDGLFDSDVLGLDGFLPSTYNGDDVLEPSWDFEDFPGVSVGPWNAPFDGKEMGLRGFQPEVTAPYKISGAPSNALSSQISGASASALFSQLSITSPATESHYSSISNSSSNRYTEKNYKSSTNPMAHYPVSARSISVHAQSAEGTSSVESSFSKTVDRARALPEESTNSHKVKGEEAFDVRTTNNNLNVNTVIVVDSSIMQKGTSSGSGYASSMKPIMLPKTLTSESDSAKQDNSSETLSHLDLDVDSPCWKGTSAYQQSPFHVDDTVTPYLTAVKSVTDTNVAESQPNIPTNHDYAKAVYNLEISEDLISDETKIFSSTSHSEKSSDVSSSSLQKRSEYPYKIESENSCKRIQCFDISEEQRTDTTRDKQTKSEAQDEKALQLDREATVISSNLPRAADDITIPKYDLQNVVQNSAGTNQRYAVDVTAPCITVESYDSSVLSCKASAAGEHAMLIDEMLQCLRERLLSQSHAYKDENSLKELLNDILLLVNDYFEAFVLKNKKGIAGGCCNDSGPVADRSQIRGLRGQGHAVINQSNMNNIQGTMGKEGDTILEQSNTETSDDTGVQEKMRPTGHHTTHRQVITGSFHGSASEGPRSHIIGLKGDAASQSNVSINHDKKEKYTMFVGLKRDAVNQSSIGIPHDMKEKFTKFTGYSISDKFENSPSNLTIMEGMANDFKKILKKTFCEQEENLQTVLHKNLWIEAEAKLFSMKYELQFAHTKIEILKHNMRAKGGLETTRLSSMDSWQDSLASNPLIATGESRQKLQQDMSKREKDDASLMACLGILERERERAMGQICRQDVGVSAKRCLGAHEHLTVNYESRFCN